MGDIKNYNPAEEETLDSREVAEMVERSSTKSSPGHQWIHRRYEAGH